MPCSALSRFHMAMVDLQTWPPAPSQYQCECFKASSQQSHRNLPLKHRKILPNIGYYFHCCGIEHIVVFQYINQRSEYPQDRWSKLRTRNNESTSTESVLPAGRSVSKHPPGFCWWRQMSSDDVRPANLSVPTLAKHSSDWVTNSNRSLTQTRTKAHTNTHRMHEIFRHRRKLYCAAEFLVFLQSRSALFLVVGVFFTVIQ